MIKFRFNNMLSLLSYILVFYISFVFSKSLNSNNVLLTTELLPHTSDKRSLNLYKTKLNNSRRNTNLYKDDVENTQLTDNSKNIKFTKDESKDPDKSSENVPTRSNNGTPSVIFPFKPGFKLKLLEKESYELIKLMLLPSKFSGQYLSVLFGTTAVGSLISSLLVLIGSSDIVFGYLRNKWAFQGEMEFGSVESYTKLGLALIGFDLIFKTMFLRPYLIKNLVNPNFFENVNWFGKSLGKVDKGYVDKAIATFTNTFILTKIAFITYLHYEFMKNNWSTGSFVFNEEHSKSASNVLISNFFFTLFSHVVKNMLFGSFNTFMDTEHLLDPMEFRANERRKEIFERSSTIYKCIPDSLKKLVGTKYKYLIRLYNFAILSTYCPTGELELSFHLLNAGMAFYSNSGAGLYLVSAQLASHILTTTMDLIEKSVIAEKFTM